MACKCPKGWCYHRPDCVRGPSRSLAVKLSKAWCEAAARREEGYTIAAGVPDKFEGAAPWRGEVDRRQAISPAPPSVVKDDDEPRALACNGPQVARLELLMKRRDELADIIAGNGPGVGFYAGRALTAAAKVLDEAIDRVQHEGTPLDWRLRE